MSEDKQRYAIGEHVVVCTPDFASSTIHALPARVLTYLPPSKGSEAGHYRVRLDTPVQVRDSGPLFDMVAPAYFVLRWPKSAAQEEKQP